MNRLTVREAYEKWADDLVAYATVVAGRDDAADIVADTFATLLRSERDADAVAGPTPWERVQHPRAYLHRSVLNGARRRHRTTTRRSARELRHHAQRTAVAWAGTAASDSPLHDPEVMAAVRGLSPGQRAAIYLTYWDDLGLDEVAQILNCSVGSVKRQLARARSTLRETLQRQEP